MDIVSVGILWILWTSFPFSISRNQESQDKMGVGWRHPVKVVFLWDLIFSLPGGVSFLSFFWIRRQGLFRFLILYFYFSKTKETEEKIIGIYELILLVPAGGYLVFIKCCFLSPAGAMDESIPPAGGLQEQECVSRGESVKDVILQTNV